MRASLQPLVNFSLALKTLDVPNLGCRVVSLDLPVVLCDALVFEIDARFAHGAFLRQRPLRVSRSKKSPAGAGQLDLRKSATGTALTVNGRWLARGDGVGGTDPMSELPRREPVDK
jgi:hypothetical protein